MIKASLLKQKLRVGEGKTILIKTDYIYKCMAVKMKLVITLVLDLKM